MTLKTLMIVNTVIAGGFGIANVLIPSSVYSLYGITSGVELDFVARLLGASFIVFAVLLWKARNIGDSEAQAAIKWAFFTGHSIAFVASLLAQLNNVTNSLGWSIVAIYLLLALGFGYFLFFQLSAERQEYVGTD